MSTKAMYQEAHRLLRRARGASDPSVREAAAAAVFRLRGEIRRVRAQMVRGAVATVLDSGTPRKVRIEDAAWMHDGALVGVGETVDGADRLGSALAALRMPREWAERYVVVRLDRSARRPRIVRSRPVLSSGATLVRSKPFVLAELVDEDRERENLGFTRCQVRLWNGSWQVFTRTRIDFLAAERSLFGPASRVACMRWAQQFETGGTKANEETTT